MPLIGNGITSKKTGKSGLNNRIYQAFYGISKKHAEIDTEKVSLSTGSIIYITHYFTNFTDFF